MFFQKKRESPLSQIASNMPCITWDSLQLVNCVSLFSSSPLKQNSAYLAVQSFLFSGKWRHSPWQSPTSLVPAFNLIVKRVKMLKRLMSQELSKPLKSKPKRRKWWIILQFWNEILSGLPQHHLNRCPALCLSNDRNLKTYTGQKIDDFDREGNNNAAESVHIFKLTPIHHRKERSVVPLQVWYDHQI